VTGTLLSRFDISRVLALMLAAVFAAAQAASPSPDLSYRPSDPLNSVAFSHFYNLDYDRAVQEFEQVLQRHPNDPFAVNHLLTAVLFRELYRVGALNTSEYANDSFVHVAHRAADPAMQKEIKDLVQRALGLEEKLLSANPKDVGALYARGVTRAQFATYTGLIERAWFSALRNALGARHDHERVLELDPSDGLALYHSACAHALLGETSPSLMMLRRAFDSGFRAVAQAASADSAFASIAAEPEFRRLVAELL